MPKRFTESLKEFIVIVIGVFVAVAAESWWSEREDRRIEREFREDMMAEFEANIRILEADLATNEGARPRFAILEGRSGEALKALTDEQITGMFYPYIDWAGFDPEMGTVQALVESGNLALVSDRELRLGLARWAGERRELQIHLSQLLRLFDTTVDNQRQLLATAQDILEFLREPD